MKKTDEEVYIDIFPKLNLLFAIKLTADVLLLVCSSHVDWPLILRFPKTDSKCSFMAVIFLSYKSTSTNHKSWRQQLAPVV